MTIDNKKQTRKPTKPKKAAVTEKDDSIPAAIPWAAESLFAPQKHTVHLTTTNVAKIFACMKKISQVELGIRAKIQAASNTANMLNRLRSLEGKQRKIDGLVNEFVNNLERLLQESNQNKRSKPSSKRS